MTSKLGSSRLYLLFYMMCTFKCSALVFAYDVRKHIITAPLIHNTFVCFKTIRRKRKVQIPVSRPGDRETMSEHEEDESDEDGYEHHSGRDGRSGYEGASGGKGTGRRHDREASSTSRRDHSASRDQSVSPRSERRSLASSAPPRPAKVTLVKSRKNEGQCQCANVPAKMNSEKNYINMSGKNILFTVFLLKVSLRI